MSCSRNPLWLYPIALLAHCPPWPDRTGSRCKSGCDTPRVETLRLFPYTWIRQVGLQNHDLCLSALNNTLTWNQFNAALHSSFQPSVATPSHAPGTSKKNSIPTLPLSWLSHLSNMFWWNFSTQFSELLPGFVPLFFVLWTEHTIRSLLPKNPYSCFLIYPAGINIKQNPLHGYCSNFILVPCGMGKVAYNLAFNLFSNDYTWTYIVCLNRSLTSFRLNLVLT